MQTIYTFKPQYEIGKAFEASVAHLLEIKNWTIEWNESTELKKLQEYDFIARKPEYEYKIETKKDLMSERTNRVCIDYDSLSKSQSSIFIIGLPTAYGTDIYTMPLKSIYQYAKDYPIQKAVGQWGYRNALIAKNEFIYLPFVKRFTMEEKLDPYGLRGRKVTNSVA